VIDDLPYREEELPGKLRDISWHSVADGIGPAFVTAVKERYKKNQRD
jgi:hypothetical protein